MEPLSVAGVAVFQDKLRGEVWFVPHEGTIWVVGRVSGIFPPGEHGCHVHKFGNLSDGPLESANLHCQAAGGHWNPGNCDHGSRTDLEAHAGDLGNIFSDTKGIAAFRFAAPKVTLTGPNSVVGRSLVIHADEDDLGKGRFADSLTTGHSGKRLGCAVIGYADLPNKLLNDLCLQGAFEVKPCGEYRGKDCPAYCLALDGKCEELTRDSQAFGSEWWWLAHPQFM